MCPIYMQGLNQQTPAVQNQLSRVSRSNGTGSRRRANSGGSTKRKKRSRSTGGTRRKKASSSSRSSGRFVKGSAAAKRYMAKLRKMRSKKKSR